MNLKQVIQTHKRFKRTLFIRIKTVYKFSCLSPTALLHTFTTLFRTFLLFTFKPPNQHRNENVKTDSVQLLQKMRKTAALTLRDRDIWVICTTQRHSRLMSGSSFATVQHITLISCLGHLLHNTTFSSGDRVPLQGPGQSTVCATQNDAVYYI